MILRSAFKIFKGQKMDFSIIILYLIKIDETDCIKLQLDGVLLIY